VLVAAVVGIVAFTGGVAYSYADFGTVRDALIVSKSQTLFGIKAPRIASSTVSADPGARPRTTPPSS